MKLHIKILIIAAFSVFLVEAVIFYFTTYKNDSTVSLTKSKVNKQDSSLKSDTVFHNRPIQRPEVSETPSFDMILTFLHNVEADVHNINHEEMSKKYSADLRGYGFVYKGWIHDIDDLADHYGSYVYCKNCGVNNVGLPTSMKKGSCMIKFSSYGYGPCVTLYTLDEELYDNIKQQLQDEGYIIDTSEKDGNQLVKHNSEEDTFITFYKRIKVYSLQVWRYSISK